MKKIKIIQPDDWHCHLRDGNFLSRTVSDTAHRFARVIVMPNLPKPIINLAAASYYYNRIKEHIPKGSSFKPLLTLYLTDDTTPKLIQEAEKSDLIIACKLYPAGATTNSTHGVRNIDGLYPVFEAMQKLNMPLLLHAEIPDDEIDIFDREALFIEKFFTPLAKQFPSLRIVMEHVSSKIGVDFVLAQSPFIAATITPHHLLFNRNDLLAGGIKPHLYCLPIVKRHSDQQALIQAATSGNAKFFLGTDSAPHLQKLKENPCGCAGVYSAYNALEIYAEIFECHQALDKLENFSSRFGAQFYQLPVNVKKITLIKEDWYIPESLPFGNGKVVPLWADQELHWQILKSREQSS